ncbi:lytic transglycosylase domain-containing protein [Dongia sedimenti]|uniref:Lytic transglycosylase domain-containing protein n=1 Tax=Dongia sedimenti TaxID=3064282 RepID=A0ABU0YS42_9PROT|nr:lytic transglycosylase domain-containing protein [Rhodospirillaceae bacterium R-7]
MRAPLVAALVVVSCFHGAAAAQEARPLDPETRARIEALDPFIDEAARRSPVPMTWIRAVIAAESGGRTELNGKPITSPAGAMGPMQVMPETYEEMRRRYGLGPDPYDPENNILAGTAYLAELYRRFGMTGMFAAYNAGPDRYQQFLDDGRPLPAETKAYLAALHLSGSGASAEPSFASGQGLFFQLQNRSPPGSVPHPEIETGGLFVPLVPPEPDPAAGSRGAGQRREGSRLGQYQRNSQVEPSVKDAWSPQNAGAFWLPHAPLRGAMTSRP